MRAAAGYGSMAPTPVTPSAVPHFRGNLCSFIFFAHFNLCQIVAEMQNALCASSSRDISTHSGAFHYQLLLNVLILRLASASPSPPLARSFFFLYISLFLLSFSPHCCCCLVNTVLCFCFHVFASVCERRACCFYFLLIVA